MTTRRPLDEAEESAPVRFRTEAGTALYYPNLKPDLGWLKSSLLYWERVRRIVPNALRFEVRDSKEVNQAAGAGCLLTGDPRDYAVAAAELFKARVLPWANRESEQSATMWGTFANRRGADYVYSSKMSEELRDLLLRSGRAEKRGDWMRMAVDLSAGYMACLATVMSREMGCPMVTDVPRVAPGGEYLLHADALPEECDGEAVRRSFLLRLGIEFPTADSVANLTMRQILDFRERRADERRRFREAVEALGVGCAELKDPAAIEDFIVQKRGEIKSAIRDHRKALREARIETGVSALAISTPAMAAAGAATVAGTVFAPVLAGIGIAVSLVAWWVKHRARTRKAIRECPWHYVQSLASATRR